MLTDIYDRSLFSQPQISGGRRGSRRRIFPPSRRVMARTAPAVASLLEAQRSVGDVPYTVFIIPLASILTINFLKAALFPCGISLAATWNKDLLHEVGEHLAVEAKARSANVLLAPTVCMHRHPLGGRNFESFSEDPLLTGKLASQYIQGLQQNGVAATIKRSSKVVALAASVANLRLQTSSAMNKRHTE